jgi:hypothetical protein
LNHNLACNYWGTHRDENMPNKTITKFIQTKHIDSFQKLRLLIYLQERPDQEASSQEFAERLHLGDTVLLDGIVRDLQRVGLLVRIDRCWKLCDEPKVRSCLRGLVGAFESPVDRQEIIEQVRKCVPFSDHWDESPELH